jgi:hypothetical protein
LRSRFDTWQPRDGWSDAEQACLDAVEQRRAAGHHLLSAAVPEGTPTRVIGAELIRRIGLPALVLVKGAEKKRPWADAAAELGPVDGVLWVRTYAHLGAAGPRGALGRQAAADVNAFRNAGARLLVLDNPRWVIQDGQGAIADLVRRLEPDGILALSPAGKPEADGWLWDLLGISRRAQRVSVDTEVLGTRAEIDHAVRVQLSVPLGSEREWLAGRRARFDEALATLGAGPPGAEQLGLDEWLSRRFRDRRGEDGGQLAWAALEQALPFLAQSGRRWLAWSAGDRGAQLSDDDWAVLLDDYVRHCLRAPGNGGREATRRAAVVEAELRDLGYRFGADGTIDRDRRVVPALANSATKLDLLCEVLAVEEEARGSGLRAVVLTETLEGLGATLAHPLPLDGGGLGILEKVALDERLVLTRPLLIAPDTIAVAAGDLAAWQAPGPLEIAPGRLVATGPADASALAWAVEALRAGRTRLLIVVGAAADGEHRAQANVVVDLSTTYGVAYEHELLRESGGVAWELVCVDPSRTDGGADYARFAAQRSPEAVQPGLRADGPPDPVAFTELNLHQRDAVLAETPRSYVLQARQMRARHPDSPRGFRAAFGGHPVWGVTAILLVAAIVSAFVVFHPTEEQTDTAGAVALYAAAAIGALVAAVAMVRKGLRRAVRELPLDTAAAIVSDAAGAPVSASVAFTVQPDGSLRLVLAGMHSQTAEQIRTGLEQLVRPVTVPKFVVARPVAGFPLLSRRAWHPVPDVFAADRDAQAAFLWAWQTHLGPGTMVSTRAGGRRVDELVALAMQPGGIERGPASILPPMSGSGVAPPRPRPPRKPRPRRRGRRR